MPFLWIHASWLCSTMSVQLHSRYSCAKQASSLCCSSPQGHLATSILPGVLSLGTEWLHPARVFVVSAPCRILKKACRLVRSTLVLLDQNCAKDSYNDLIMLQMMVWRCYGASSWALFNLLVLTWPYPLTQGQTCYHCLVRSVL